MFKRFALFFAVSLLISISVSIIGSFIFRYLGIQAGRPSGAFVMSLLYGMIGSFISLGISKWTAKTFMRVQRVEDNPNYAWLVTSVHSMAQKAGIQKMPEVGVYDSPDVNAFATGPSKNNSLVAVSTGLLQRMDKEEVEGVIGHEVAHAPTETWSPGLCSRNCELVCYFYIVYCHKYCDECLKKRRRRTWLWGLLFTPVCLFNREWARWLFSDADCFLVLKI